jgi:UDP-glucose 4-epimerase
MKVIVTGGCGYIGSVVASEFKKSGSEVFTIDRVERSHTLSTVDGYLIADFVSSESFYYMNNIEPDIIVHCAGTSLVGPSVLNPGEYYDNNVSKTIQLLNEIKNWSKKPIVLFSSSASVYGEPNQIPVTELDEVKPISPYGKTKAMIETIFKDYFYAYGIRSVCFRYFNAAGAVENPALGQEPNASHIVAKVLEAVISGNNFNLYGNQYNTKDGTCIRDYVHVVDIAQAHIKASNYADTNPGAHIFNLGSNIGTSNGDIIKMAREKYNLKGVDVVEPRAGDPAQLIADATKAYTSFNWNPANNIDSIMESAYKWYTRK